MVLQFRGGIMGNEINRAIKSGLLHFAGNGEISCEGPKRSYKKTDSLILASLGKEEGNVWKERLAKLKNTSPVSSGTGDALCTLNNKAGGKL